MTEVTEVAVLALPHVVAFELGLPHRFLGGAVDDDGRPLYRVRTCTVDGGPVRTSAHYSVLPDHDASILRTAATIVVPGIVGGPPVAEGRLEPALAAALATRRPDARLVSICTGAFVLAAAGVLDGRPATTHWMRTEPFHSFFPSVRLDPDVLYVDDGDVLTSTARRSRTGWHGAMSSHRGATAGSRSSASRRLRQKRGRASARRAPSRSNASPSRFP
jgi:transcriptional regulator GlxA family with amidase domain